MKKIIVLIGNYGSGKTEIAVNLAVNSAAEGKRTLVVDLDKVNDYFRMSDWMTLLGENNIRLVSPTFAGQGATPSSMSAAVASAFADNWDLMVFDVGSDSAGALSLGRYHPDFEAFDGELQVYNADGRDTKYIGTPLPIETYMHRSWEAFTSEGF